MLSFFKPKWQHKDVQVRLSAIDGLDVKDNALMTMAKGDADPEVRIAALKKLGHIELLCSLWTGEENDAVQDVIIKALAVVVSASKEPSISKKRLAQFLAVVNGTQFPIGSLILACQDRYIAQKLFNHIDNPQDYVLLINHKHWLHSDALAAVGDEVLLAELLKSVRSSDKRTYRAIKERLEAVTQKKALAHLKTELLTAYKALADSEPLSALNIFSDLEARWNQHDLGDEQRFYREKYLARHHEYNQIHSDNRAVIDTINTHLLEDGASVSSLKVAYDQLTQLMDHGDLATKDEAVRLQALINKKIEGLTTQKRQQQSNRDLYQTVEKLLQQPYQINPDYLEKMITQVRALDRDLPKKQLFLTKLEDRKRAQNDKAGFNHEHFLALLQELQHLIEVGTLAPAQQKQQELREYMQHAVTLSKQVYDRYWTQIRTLLAPLREMNDWAKWSGTQVLEQLCVDAEALSVQKLTHDFLVLSLKHLRKDWQEAAKGLGRRSYPFKKRFDRACEQAFEQVKGVRAQEEVHRTHYLNEAQALLANLNAFVEEINWSAPNWSELVQTRARFLSEWNRYLTQHSTGALLSFGTPLFLERDRRSLERRMRTIMAPFNKQLKDERMREKARREALLDELFALSSGADLDAAIEYAKKANKAFVPTVRLHHREEHRLWTRLRTLCDAIFEQRQHKLDVADGERSDNLMQKNTILTQLNEFVEALQEGDIAHGLEQITHFETRWQAVGVVPKNAYKEIENQFKMAVEAFKAKRAQLLAIQAKRARQALYNTAAALGVLEAQALDHAPIEDEVGDLNERAQENAELSARCARLVQIVSGDKVAYAQLQRLNSLSAAKAQELCLLREIFTEQPSPEADKEARMALQMVLLQNVLTARDRLDKSQQLIALEQKWFEQVVGTPPHEFVQRFMDTNNGQKT